MPQRPHDSADRYDAARWETGQCPPLTGFLMVVSAQLEPVDDDAALERLDELARPLFGLAERDGREQARELAGVLTREPTFTLDELAPSGLHVDAVLERRSGHPLMLAVVLAEVGLRAGLSTVALSSPRGWYTGLSDGQRLQLIDTAAEPLPAPDSVRRHCAHEVAFAALLGLTDRYRRLGDDVRADRAAALRRRLCVASADHAPTHGAFDPLEVLWNSTPPTHRAFNPLKGQWKSAPPTHRAFNPLKGQWKSAPPTHRAFNALKGQWKSAPPTHRGFNALKGQWKSAP